MLTPQAIKDQEFQVKFRGYDSIEVKAYLELLAEDFFELTEQNRVQAEELEALQVEHEALSQEKERLAAEVQANQEDAAGLQSEIQESYEHKVREIASLREEIESLRVTVATLEKEKGENLLKIKTLEATVANESSSSQRDVVEVEKLRAKVEMLEERNAELKQEGIDFKTAILAAQKFADNLRETAQEDARKMMEEAKTEVANFRNEAEAELSRLPEEIAALNQRKVQVKEELRLLLQSYLDSLDMFPEMGDGAENGEELEDLLGDIDLEGAMDSQEDSRPVASIASRMD